MRPVLPQPDASLAPLPALAASIGTGFGSDLAPAYAQTFAENTPKINGMRAFSGAEGAGLLPVIASMPFTENALDSTLILTENSGEMAFDIGSEIITAGVKGLGSDALAGFLRSDALSAITDTVGSVVQPLVGAIPIAGGFINAAISIFKLAFGRRKASRPPPPPIYEAAEFVPENDIALAQTILRNESVDLTAYFLPPPMQTQNYTPSSGTRRTFADRVFSIRRQDDKTLQITTWANMAPSLRNDWLGYVPGTGTSGLAGSPAYLHDSIIVDPDRYAAADVGVYDTGDFFPTARSAILNVWGTVSSPTPSIWTVDADLVMQRWYNYVQVLRDFLHKGTRVKEELTPKQLKAVDRFLAMRLLSIPGARAQTINVDDETLWNHCIPVKAARRLMQQQAWAQSHPSGLILMADPFDRDWGAFSGNSSGSTELRDNYSQTRNAWAARNRDTLCELRPEELPPASRPIVQQWQDATGCKPDDRIREGTRTQPGKGAKANPLLGYATGAERPGSSIDGSEDFPGGEDQDKDGGDPYGPVSAAGSGIAALIAIGLVGGTLAIRSK